MSTFEGYEGSGSIGIQHSQSVDLNDMDGSDASVAMSMTFVNEWLNSIADSVVGIIFSQIVMIPALSPSGRSQLEVDLAYIRYLRSVLFSYCRVN